MNLENRYINKLNLFVNTILNEKIYFKNKYYIYMPLYRKNIDFQILPITNLYKLIINLLFRLEKITLIRKSINLTKYEKNNLINFSDTKKYFNFNIHHTRIQAYKLYYFYLIF